MEYRIVYTEKFERDLWKLSQEQSRRILSFLKDLDGTENPRQRGKALTGPLIGFWRYRVGDYRIICEIRDEEVVAVALKAAHRR